MVINRLIWAYLILFGQTRMVKQNVRVANLRNRRLGDFYTSQNCLNVHAKNSRVPSGNLT